MRFRDSTTQSVNTVLTGLLVLAMCGLGGCSGSEQVAPFDPVTDPGELFMSLTLDHHAINLSAAESAAPAQKTLQLTATPRNAAGTLMPGLPAPVFHSSDTTAVQVSADGLVTALREATGVWVTAEIVAPGNVRRADSASVNVTSMEPPTLAGFLLNPVAPDSAVWAMWSGGVVSAFIAAGFLGIQLNPNLTPHAFDASNAEINGLAVEYMTLDSSIALVDRWTGAVQVRRPGSVQMVARTTAYGITKEASATFTTTLPVEMQVVVHTTPNGILAIGPGQNAADGVASEYRIAPYGLVVWGNLTNDPVELQFEDPTNVGLTPSPVCDIMNSAIPGSCGAGDVLIPPASTPDCASFFDCPYNLQIRQFPVPGTYRFHSRAGIAGQIVVAR